MESVAGERERTSAARPNVAYQAGRAGIMLDGVDNEQGHQGLVNGTHAGTQGEGNQHSTERGGAQGEAQRQNAGGEFALTGQSNAEIIAQEEVVKKAKQGRRKNSKERTDRE